MYPKHCLYHPFARVYLSMYANLYDHRFFKRAKMPKLNWNSYFEGQSKRPLFATNRTPLQTLTGISTDLTSLVWVFVLSLKKKKTIPWIVPPQYTRSSVGGEHETLLLQTSTDIAHPFHFWLGSGFSRMSRVLVVWCSAPLHPGPPVWWCYAAQPSSGCIV